MPRSDSVFSMLTVTMPLACPLASPRYPTRAPKQWGLGMRVPGAGIGLLLAGTFLFGAFAFDFNWALLVLGMAFLYGSILYRR